MKGSEKQIAWATSLIKKMNERFEDMLAECKQLYQDNYDECNLILGTIKAAFEEAPAGEVIDLLKDRKETDGKEYYNALYHAVFASSSSVAEKVKEIISNRICSVNLIEEAKSDDIDIEVTKLQNEKYTKEEYGIELVIGSKYCFTKGISETRNGAYYLYLDGQPVKEMSVPIGYGFDVSGNRYSIFKIVGIDDPVAFKQI